VLRSGLQVDLRVVPPASFGAALLYFTGSKSHNIALRGIANEHGWKLNEYGLFSGRRRIAGATEEEIYRKLGLTFVPPELREDRGEVALAGKNWLPELITLADIRGDLHVHSNWTDGTQPIAEMAGAARERGYSYMAMTDHSRRVTVAKGLDPARLSKQIVEIDRLNDNHLLAAAHERGCHLEINAQPDRLDLMDVHAQAAKAAGVKIAISTDAHSAANLDNMRFGVDQARRGWLETADVVNTRPLSELRKLLRR
jgi:DNA polymerase (family 10)